MGLADDLNARGVEIFQAGWQERAGKNVPEPDDVALGNDAVTLEGTCLYADLAESTALVQGYNAGFAARVYKAYLHCASKVILAEGGVITAFDGDRVMGVFVGTARNTAAARCALKINHCVVKILNPILEKREPKVDYRIRHAVGVDSSPLFVARTGVRGSNDLVWVGRAANYAAKLSGLRDGNACWITKEVHDNLENAAKFGAEGKSMWEARTWQAHNLTVYRSTWSWKP